MPRFEAEEFWDDLLAIVEQGRVIPVLGPELLTIEDQGQRIPLYRAIADLLLGRHGLPPLDQESYGLYEAVSALAASGRRLKTLYRPIHDILLKVTREHPETLGPLNELAAIRDFNLFVTTTPDNLLARAINDVRFAGAKNTDEISFAPPLPTLRNRDIPEVRDADYAAVFYLLGKADVEPYFAIHEEDALEFPYTLQRANSPERMLSEMRRRSLLLVGCTFADWLNRFFLRLSNNDRLSSDQRTKKEFLVGTRTVQDRDFVVFLERFSQDSRCFPADAAAFVSELLARWRERNPAKTAAPGAEAIMPSTSADMVFISYAKEDIGAARSLFEEFEKVSGKVAWFDKTDLRPGDDWDRAIRGAIQKCSLFVPILSSNTEDRDEGYFRAEWRQAAQRSERIEGRKLIFPIVIDPDYDRPERYARVPDLFKTLQFSHAPSGRMSEDLRKKFVEEIRSSRRVKS